MDVTYTKHIGDLPSIPADDEDQIATVLTLPTLRPEAEETEFAGGTSGGAYATAALDTTYSGTTTTPPTRATRGKGHEGAMGRG